MQINSIETKFKEIRSQLPKRWQNTIAKRCNCSVGTVYASTKGQSPFHQKKVWEAIKLLLKETEAEALEEANMIAQIPAGKGDNS